MHARRMEQRLNFITLVVSDIDATRRFYVDGLGWQPAMDVPDEVLMFHVADKVVLSLWAERAAEVEIGPVQRGGTAPITLAHNLSSAAEVDTVLDTARAAGADVHPGQQREWGGYTGYFTDPDGFHWEVAFNPNPIGDVTIP